MQLPDFFKTLKTHWESKLPFVVYKNPNDYALSATLQQDTELVKNLDFSSAGYVFAPFNTDTNFLVWFPDENSVKITTRLYPENISPSKTEITEDSTLKKVHLSILKKAKQELNAENLQKVVISRNESVKIEHIKPFDWLVRMCNLYPNTYCYCWYHPKVGMWLGATPETLIKLKNKSFSTMALAGTMPYIVGENVEWGTKEIEEQQMVVDYIVRALQPVTESLKKGSTKTQRAGSLLHLQTPISGTLTNTRDLKLIVELLHPTSAVCGLPKEKSKQFILENENYKREFYTGYLGYFKPDGHTDLFVNLRCMKVEKNSAKLFIGGGITAASDLENEWQETVNKSQIMKSIL